MNEIISIICAKENQRGVILEPYFIHGFSMVAIIMANKFNLNLVRETGCLDKLKILNREGL